MVPRHFFTAAICATLLAWSGPSIADQYRPGEFLSLDLSKAVLSPKPLGPATQFAPFPVEAGADPDGAAPQTRAETKPAPEVHVARTRAGASGREEAACARREPGSRTATAIRWTRRRPIRGFRSGRAGPAASATGRGRRRGDNDAGFCAVPTKC